MIVVDANVLAAYAAGDSADIEALLVRDAVWIAPPIWLPEMRNILAKSIRAGRIELEQAMHALGRVRKRVTTADRAISSRRVLELAGSSAGCQIPDDRCEAGCVILFRGFVW